MWPYTYYILSPPHAYTEHDTDGEFQREAEAQWEDAEIATSFSKQM